MGKSGMVFEDSWGAAFAGVAACATRREYTKGDPIFSGGEVADYVYFIESGQVLIFVQKFTVEEEIKTLGPGDCFGEMAVFYKGRRTASARALTDVSLMSLDKGSFVRLLKSERALADKINALLARRNEELILKENVIDVTGMKGRHLHVGIKGDPSLRESAFTRERYQSIADKVMPQLTPRLEEMLIERSVCEIVVHFNSGEIRAVSVFNPFYDEIHPADKIVDEVYVDRHFPRVPYEDKSRLIRRLYGAIGGDDRFKTPYEDKSRLIRRLYGAIGGDDRFKTLPEPFKRIYAAFYDRWEALSPDEIRVALSRIAMLRDIPYFYLRNFTMSMARKAIRLQFNCDGTHIVSADDYARFVEENLTS
ncbi:MAG: cyclic nucleotide-binding domain-containing protein [Nitrospirae bacterium]|nr:cyclic nucleotide-binding domain-containing protein [Nitrospirota bacterium]